MVEHGHPRPSRAAPPLMLFVLLAACIPHDRAPPRPAGYGYDRQRDDDRRRDYQPQSDDAPRDYEPQRVYEPPRDDDPPRVYEPPRHDRPPRVYTPPRRQQPQRADRYVPDPSIAPPVWQPQPVDPDARTIPASSYVVMPGDNLRIIGDRTGVGAEAIARENGMAEPFNVYPGQRLAVPGGRYHQVRAGQNGIGIARAYGVDWGRIVAANDLAEPYTLRVRQRVLIPGSPAGPAAAAGRSSVAERAAAFHLDVDDLVTGSEPALAFDQRPARPSSSPTRILPPTAAITTPAQLRGGFGWPVTGRIVARFGPGAAGERNNGIKIAVPVATPILAAADGVVAYAGSEIPSLGGLVILKHGGGWTTVYGHASKLLVQRGQSVTRGQRIALSGDTGFADRPEVHFEMRKGRTPVDPVAQLPRL